MYIDHIRTFLEVAGIGSFQGAAEKLHVTQSTVSTRIKALEEKLNRPLFHRKRNGVEMTSGGQRFHPHALTVVQAWTRAKQDVALSETYSSIIQLGVQLNHWNHLAVPWLNWMEQNLPDTATQVTAEYSDSLMRRVRDGVLELAVVYHPQHAHNIIIEELLSESLILVSTTSRKIEDRQVPGYFFIDWGEYFRARHSAAFPNVPNHRMSVGLASIGLEHILEWGGSGYFVESMVKDLLKQGRLHRVTDAPVFEHPLYLVYQAEPLDRDLLRLAIEGLKAALV